MQPVQITVRDIPHSAAIESHIRKKAEKLNQFYQRINSCRIVLTIPQKHKHNGKLFAIHIDLKVPGKELVVNKQTHEDVYVAIRDAFNALIRQLETYARKKKGHVKTHDGVARGYVKRLFLEDGYGFIQGVDGNEFYFSTTNVAYPNFLQLEIGDLVEYIPVHASDGIQAHRVKKEGHFDGMDEEY
jgi:ribosomal subunit interface protein